MVAPFGPWLASILPQSEQVLLKQSICLFGRIVWRKSCERIPTAALASSPQSPVEAFSFSSRQVRAGASPDFIFTNQCRNCVFSSSRLGLQVDFCGGCTPASGKRPELLVLMTSANGARSQRIFLLALEGCRLFLVYRVILAVQCGRGKPQPELCDSASAALLAVRTFSCHTAAFHARKLRFHLLFGALKLMECFWSLFLRCILACFCRTLGFGAALSCSVPSTSIFSSCSSLSSRAWSVWTFAR